MHSAGSMMPAAGRQRAVNRAMAAPFMGHGHVLAHARHRAIQGSASHA